MSSICDICANRCFGIDGYDGSCCTLENRDFIIGKVTDADQFLERLNSKLGRKFLWNEIFIGFEEGKNLFPDKSVWQNPDNFPCMRVDTSNPRFPCLFYNTRAKFCSVHDIRPATCDNYYCEYVVEKVGIKDNKQAPEQQNMGEDLPQQPTISIDPFST